MQNCVHAGYKIKLLTVCSSLRSNSTAKNPTIIAIGNKLM